MSNKTQYSLATWNYYHVYNRGVNRGRIFLARRNYPLFLGLVDAYHDPETVDLVAFCLMPNHFHFLLLQKHPYAIAGYMQRVCDRYVKIINKAHGRVGHLLGGSYKIKPVRDPRYLVHLSRYIHLNPVRRNLVATAADWEFSSYRIYLGLEKGNSVVSPEHVLRVFNGREEYRQFVEHYRPADRLIIADALFGEK